MLVALVWYLTNGRGGVGGKWDICANSHCHQRESKAVSINTINYLGTMNIKKCIKK